jgi:hypothetical protein
LDVSRFKYPPHWVPLSLLYEAMSSLDPVTGMPRGYLLMTSQPVMDSAMFTLDIRSESWHVAKEYIEALPDMIIAHVRDHSHLPCPEAKTSLIQKLVRSMPWSSVSDFIVVRGQWVEDEDRCVPAQSRQALVTELGTLMLFQVKSMEWVGNRVCHAR